MEKARAYCHGPQQAGGGHIAVLNPLAFGTLGQTPLLPIVYNSPGLINLTEGKYVQYLDTSRVIKSNSKIAACAPI